MEICLPGHLSNAACRSGVRGSKGEQFVQIWCFLCVWAWLVSVWVWLVSVAGVGRSLHLVCFRVVYICTERVYIYVKGILSRPIKTLRDNHMTLFVFN